MAYESRYVIKNTDVAEYLNIFTEEGQMVSNMCGGGNRWAKYRTCNIYIVYQ